MLWTYVLKNDQISLINEDFDTEANETRVSALALITSIKEECIKLANNKEHANRLNLLKAFEVLFLQMGLQQLTETGISLLITSFFLFS